jgi:hypothetical protein
VLRDGALENMIDLRDGGEVVMAPNGFGVLGPAGPARTALSCSGGICISAPPLEHLC